MRGPLGNTNLQQVPNGAGPPFVPLLVWLSVNPNLARGEQVLLKLAAGGGKDAA